MKKFLLLLAFLAGMPAWLLATPQTLSISCYDVTAGQPVTFDAHAVDPDAELVALHFYINGPDLPGWNYIGSAQVGGNDAWGSISWTPSQPGGFAVHVRAENVYGEWDWNANMANSFNVSSPNQSPQTNWVSADNTVAGQVTTFTGNASDPDGNLQWLHFFVTGPNLPGWNYAGSASVGGGNATASITWTPSEPGAYAVHVRAQDDWGWYDWNANVASDFNVGSPNSNPQTNWVHADNVLTGHPTTLMGNASDPDGNLQWMNFYITGPGMPGWNYVGSASVNGGSATASINWTPSQPGSYAVHVRAQDDWGWYDWNGNVASDFTVTSNHPPQTISVSATNVSLGSPTTITGRATDPDGNLWTASFYVAGPNLPAWTYIGGANMSGSDSTTTRQWTPPYPGTYTIHIRAYDDLTEVDWNGGIMFQFTVGDGSAPSVPAGLQDASVTATSFTLSWNASTDNVGVTAYEVSKNGTALPTVSGTSLGVTGLAPGTTYAMAVRARDAAGNWSGWSAARNVTTTSDTSPPSVPGGLNDTLVAANSFTLTWAPSTDNVGVTAYEVQRDSQTLGTVGSTSMVISNLAPDTDYAMNVRARDAAGNWSNWSSARVVHTSEGTGSASNQSVWLDIDGDGIRDEIMRADTTRFNYTIATWWTEYELYWEYDVNQYWTPWDFAWASGYSETGFTPVWEPTWYYFPSFSYTRTYANMAFTVDAETGYDYLIEADTSGSGTVIPAHWHSIFGTMSFPNPGVQNVLWGNVDLDEVYYTQFFYVRLGKPVGSISLSSVTGAVLGQALPGIPLRVTLPSDGTLILSIKDLLGKILKNGPQVQWTVLNPVSGQTIDPWHIADYLNLGVNGSGQWLVGVKLDNDSTQIWFTIDVQPSPPPPPSRILLLLHGMNADVTTWNAFRNAAFNGSVGDIVPNVPISTSIAPDAHGVRCYRLQFGAYEPSLARPGLEGLLATDFSYASAPCGDFEDFNTLGREIDDAITKLLAAYPNAQIVLLGHSRGGLAARAFLQTATMSANKAAVVGLLTTGSPHQGSPLGKIYDWLSTHPRYAPGTVLPIPENAQDWGVVDWLRNATTAYGPFIQKLKLDVRRPVIGDLASDPVDNSYSPALAALNTAAAVANLPANIVYGEIAYDQVSLGNLTLSYSVFDGIPLPFGNPPLSDQARAFILGTDRPGGSSNTRTTFQGDGIVPAGNQWFRTLSGFGGAAIPPFVGAHGVVIHTDEPGRTDDLIAELHLLVNWWN